MTTAADRAALVADLVDANRILADQGVFDAYGHVSVRAGADRFLMSRSLAPGQVEASDILEYGLDSEPVAAGAPAGYLERYIHGEIYRLRPDVGAVVHNHAPLLIPFGVVAAAALRPICHMAGFLDKGAPVFEIREAAGDATDLLIRNRTLGQALAERLGGAPIILMRGHGVTVVGANIRQVVYRAIYAELNARLQLAANSLGAATYLTPAEAEAARETNEGQLERPWRVWREGARAHQGRKDKAK
jgi:HCOMODA/2-hydroxy-3-carboxy-muconic semialdehyde decarboxylase